MIWEGGNNNFEKAERPWLCSTLVCKKVISVMASKILEDIKVGKELRIMRKWLVFFM